VLVRIVNMRGVDLSRFDFDFDLTWAALFMNPRGHVYGRYGSRDEGPAEEGLSLKGLKYAMKQSLSAYHAQPEVKPVRVARALRNEPVQPERYPAARRLKAGACIHCHAVYNFRNELLWQSRKWTKERMWIYPPPKSIGIELERNQEDRIAKIRTDSTASRSGLRAGDVLESLNGLRISSAADVQYALQHAPGAGRIPVTWIRDGRKRTGHLLLPKGWRRSDISWRASMWSMPPVTGVYGKDLSVSQKQKFGLGPKRLAFRMGRFVPKQPRKAGIRAGDIIIGINNKRLNMTMLQFNVYIREKHHVGDRVIFNIIRNGKRQNFPMQLTVRTTW